MSPATSAALTLFYLLCMMSKQMLPAVICAPRVTFRMYTDFAKATVLCTSSGFCTLMLTFMQPCCVYYLSNSIQQLLSKYTGLHHSIWEEGEPLPEFYLPGVKSASKHTHTLKKKISLLLYSSLLLFKIKKTLLLYEMSSVIHAWQPLIF